MGITPHASQNNCRGCAAPSFILFWESKLYRFFETSRCNFVREKTFSFTENTLPNRVFRELSEYVCFIAIQEFVAGPVRGDAPVRRQLSQIPLLIPKIKGKRNCSLVGVF